MKNNDIYRKAESTKDYKKYLKARLPNQDCVFCDESEMNPRSLDDSLKYFRVVETLASYAYAYWDIKEVTGHLMIVPIRHIKCVSDLNEGESQEYLSLIKKYSKLGYDVFVRNSRSVGKTINHLHTHLFKTVEQRLGVEVEYFKKDESRA